MYGIWFGVEGQALYAYENICSLKSMKREYDSDLVEEQLVNQSIIF